MWVNLISKQVNQDFLHPQLCRIGQIILEATLANKMVHKLQTIKKRKRQWKCLNRWFTQSYSSVSKLIWCRIKILISPLWVWDRADRYPLAWRAFTNSDLYRVQTLTQAKRQYQLWDLERPAVPSCILKHLFLMKKYRLHLWRRQE